MSRALIISVGTGIGGEASIQSLAHGLSYSVETLHPDIVVFITSKESKEKTLPYILETHEYEYELVELTVVDNLQRIYNELRPVFEKTRRGHSRVYVDFTSGTKAMTSCLAMLGVLYECDQLCNVVGERRNGLVQRGAENLISVRPLFAINEKKMQTAFGFFNSCQYSSALNVLKKIRPETLDREQAHKHRELTEACMTYHLWDLFNHGASFPHLKNTVDKRFNRNKRFLGKLLNSGGSKLHVYYIADLLNNAMRRGDIEKKYDDAVARLYRVIELLAQHMLASKYGVDTSKVTTHDLPAKLICEWGSELNQTPLKIGLARSYTLLSELGDPLGELYAGERLRDLLRRRNESILAHGVVPINENEYLSLKGLVLQAARTNVEGLDGLLADSRFQEIEYLNI